MANYQLQHHHKLFNPEQTVRLYAEQSLRLLYKYQELLIGVCPVCRHTVMAWVGIDELGEPGDLCAIKERRHARWLLRAEQDRAHDFELKGLDLVWGSSHLIPYQKRLIPVF